MADDLNLKTVIEAVLDAKGFEEFKQRVSQAKNQTDEAGASADKSGAHFEKLGKRLPQEAFKILSSQMIEQAGLQGRLGPLVMISSRAMETLAYSTGAMGTALGGATLGISLLIPLILSMRKEKEKAAVATRDLGHADESLILTLEALKKTTTGLTAEQDQLYDALLRVRRANQQAEMEALQKKLKEATKTMKEEGAQIVQTTQEIGFKGEAYSRTTRIVKEHAEASARAAAEVRNLKDQETILRAQMDGTTQGIKRQGEGLKKDLVEGARAAAEADKRVAEMVDAFWKQERGEVSLANEQNRKDFAKTQAEVSSGLKKNASEAEQAAKRYSSAVQEADRTILAGNVRTSKTLHALLLARRKEFTADLKHRVSDLRAAGVSEVKIAEVVASEKRRFEDEAAQFAIEAQQRKRDAEIETATASIALLGSLFGQHKAAAIAIAIIDTAKAAIAAVSPPNPPLPYSAPFLAAALAVGAAQIAAIQSAQGGFDDPANDAVVAMAFRSFGRKWADDMTSIASRSAGQGFGEGMRGYSRGGSVIHQTTKIDRGTHIGQMTFNGAYFTARQAMVEMERRRIRIERVEKRTRRRSV